MPRLGLTYIDRPARHQTASRRRAFTLVVPVFALLAGCGLSPLGPERGVDPTTTGAIAPARPPPSRAVVESVAPSDWERIRLTASTAMPTTPNGGIVDWTNPETGSTGTIAPLEAARSDPDGKNCRPIGFTVSDLRGIRRYRGDACRSADGMWQLFGVMPEDSALL